MDQNTTKENMQLTDLPEDICVEILKKLNPNDLRAFSLANRKCHRLTCDDLLWKHSFRRGYERLFEHYELSDGTEWRECYKKRYICAKDVSRTLKSLADRYVRRDGLHVPYTILDQLITEQENSDDTGEQLIMMTVDSLRDILDNREAIEKHRNLTDRFYAKQACDYLVRFKLMKTVVSQMATADDFDLKHGSLVFGQWFSTKQAFWVIEREFAADLAKLTDRVMEELAARNHLHPAVTKSREWQEMSGEERGALIAAVIYVFQTSGLTGDSEEDNDVARSCLHMVLKSKLSRPVSLCVLFYLVGKDCGAVTQLIPYPGRFHLRFESFLEMKAESDRFTYIDVWEGGEFRSYNHLFNELSPNQRDHVVMQPVAPKQVLRQMLNDLMEGPVNVAVAAFELAVQLEPKKIQPRFTLARLYTETMEYNCDKAMELLNGIEQSHEACPFIGQVIQYREQLTNQFLNFGIEPRLKTLNITHWNEWENSHVKYAVGLLMRHRKYDYKCVIYGWDPKCELSVDWQQQMGVHSLERQHKQPFYNVLVWDGSNRYAAEDNLVFEPEPEPIGHEEVPKYFQHLDKSGCFYLMNEHKIVEYPDDVKRVQEYALEHYPDKLGQSRPNQ